MDSVQRLKTVQDEGLELFRHKNRDYGDSFLQFGAVGILVRLQDKINRAVNVSQTAITFVNNESLRDTLIDLMNYSGMAVMLKDKRN